VVIVVTMAICASIAAGVMAERRWGERARTAARHALDAILWIVLPPCVFVNIAHFRFSGADVLGLILGYGVLSLVAVAAWWAGRRWLTLPHATIGALICCAIIGNTGYFGLPVTLALLGRSHLAAATAWDAIVTGPWSFVGAFAVGSAFGVRPHHGRVGGSGRRGELRTFVRRNPVLWAIAAGLVASRVLTVPHVVVVPAQLALTGLLPVGFAALGVYLGAQPGRRPWQRPDRTMCAAIGLRMGIAPALFAALASLTHGVPSAFYLQAAAPTGLNALITSHVYGLDSSYTATVVAWSTVLALAVILALVACGVA
jgi:predicted permease